MTDVNGVGNFTQTVRVACMVCGESLGWSLVEATAERGASLYVDACEHCGKEE